MEEYFKTAEYLLLEAKEYVDGAWEMIASKKWDASLTLSRWVLEASMNLWWVVVEKNKTKQRHMELVGEALRCEANLFDGLAKFLPEQAVAYNSKAKEARKMRKYLGVGKPDSLDKRIKSIKPQNRPDWPDPYVLYRICCAEAHPNLKVWERYKSVGTVTVSIKPPDNKGTASWMAAASTLYLVSFSYCLIELEYIEQLNKWWKDEVAPLLCRVP
jgi:hypothetical protein